MHTLCRPLHTGIRRADAALGCDFVRMKSTAPWHGAGQHRLAGNTMSPVFPVAGGTQPGSGCAFVDRCQACPHTEQLAASYCEEEFWVAVLGCNPISHQSQQARLPAVSSLLKKWRELNAGRISLKGDFVRRTCRFSYLMSRQTLAIIAVLPLKKGRKMHAGRDPLKGGSCWRPFPLSIRFRS